MFQTKKSGNGLNLGDQLLVSCNRPDENKSRMVVCTYTLGAQFQSDSVDT